jgi:hypothetical protein
MFVALAAKERFTFDFTFRGHYVLRTAFNHLEGNGIYFVSFDG